MQIPLNIFLTIVIPELFFFCLWMWVCIASMEIKLEKKKAKEIILRKESYPFDEGEPVTYDIYL